MRRFATLAALLLAVPATAQDRPLAIRNAMVETLAAAGRLEKATVVIRDGKIAAVARDAAIPDDATVLDAAGGTLMPGIIDPYFEVAVAAATADSGPRTVTVRGRTVTVPGGPAARGPAYTRIADNFYPFDQGYHPLPRIGLTRLNLVTAGVGQSAVIRVTPNDPERMLDKPDGLAFASVSNSTEGLDNVRTRLDAAARARGTSRPGATTPSANLWNDVLDGKTSLVVAAANSATVIHLLKSIETHKNVKLVLFIGGDAVAECVDALKGRSVKVLLRPGLELLPNTRDRFNPARMLHEAGIDFAFSLTARPPGAAAGPPQALNPDFEAPLRVDADCPLFPVAMLVKTGLPRAAALEALCKRPAAMVGIGATNGTIEAGKFADLNLYSGDPLDPASRLRQTIIDGRTTYAN